MLGGEACLGHLRQLFADFALKVCPLVRKVQIMSVSCIHSHAPTEKRVF